MEITDLLRELLPAEIVDNFDIIRYEKTKETFDLWPDEKTIQDEQDSSDEKSCGEDGCNVKILK